MLRDVPQSRGARVWVGQDGLGSRADPLLQAPPPVDAHFLGVPPRRGTGGR